MAEQCIAEGVDEFGEWKCDGVVTYKSLLLCKSCYNKHWNGRPFTRPKHLKPKTTCPAIAVGGEGLCGEPVRSNGLCHLHSNRRRFGTPDDVPRRARLSKVETDSHKAEGKKWCPDCKLTKCLSEFPTLRARVATYCTDCERWYQRLRDFKITRVEYEAVLAAQGDVCGFCGTSTPGGRGSWHVDHDHSCCPTEKTCGLCTRGLLCSMCNSRRVSDYEHLPTELQTWPEMNEYLTRRPILAMRFDEVTEGIELATT